MTQVVVPWYAGSSERRVGSALLAVPPQSKAGTTFEIKLRVDRDKLLSWHYRIGTSPWQAAKAFADPWSPTPPTVNDRRLLELRRQMKQAHDSKGEVPLEMQLTELTHLWRTGRVDDLDLRLCELEGEPLEPEQQAAIANLRGLVSSSHGNVDLATMYHKRAASLNATSAVYLGNLGCQLDEAGRKDEAVAHMRAALAIDASQIYLYERLATISRSRGDEAAARVELNEAAKHAQREVITFSSWPEAWERVARIQRALGNYQRADEAKVEADKLRRNERYGGDHTLLLEGPDGTPGTHRGDDRHG